MRKIFFFILLFPCVNIYAISIIGTVIDAETKQPIENANVVLTRLDSTIISHSITQKDGGVKMEIPNPGDYLLMISCIGYETSIITIKNLRKNLNIGTIELLVSNYLIDEVVVTPNDYTKIDRQIIFPQSQILNHSFTGIDVLGRLMLPGLIVNTATNSVSSMNNRPVQVRVNDVIVSMNEILAVSPQRIMKIEYIDLPGLRYGEVGTVINIILKKPEKGFSTGGNTRTGLTTPYENSFLYLKYNNRQSEFGINYNYLYSNYSDCFKNEILVLQIPDQNLNLTRSGIKSREKSIYHNISLSYNWRNDDNTVFNAIFRNNISRPIFTNKQYVDDELSKTSYLSSLITKDRNYTPALDLYFQHSFDEKQTIVANIVTTYIASDYVRDYSEMEENDNLRSDFSYNTNGKKYSLLSEIIYENKLSTSATLSSGIKYSQANLKNVYNQSNNETATSMNTADVYGYAQIQGTLAKLNYQLGIGYSMQYFNGIGGRYNNYLFRPMASLAYSLQENLTFRYNFYITPTIPGLSDLSNFQQWQNEYEVYVGNPTLKPFDSYANILSLNFRKGRISLNPSLYYQYNQKSIMSTIQRIEEDGRYYFAYSNENQKNYQHLQGRVYITTELIKNRLSITAFGVLNRYLNHGNNYTHAYTNYFGGFRLEGNYRNWSLSTSLNMKSKMLVGETLFINPMTANIETRYRHKKIQYGLEIINPFLPKGNRQNQMLISQYVKKESVSYVKNNGNFVRLIVAWNIDFGRKYDSKQKRLDNYDNDAGIMK